MGLRGVVLAEPKVLTIQKLHPNFTKGDDKKEESVLKEIILSSKKAKMGFKEGNAVLMA